MVFIHIDKQPELWFTSTFTIAFIVLIVVFLADGLRKHHTAISLSSVILCMLVFFFIGMKAGALANIADIGTFIKQSSPTSVTGKNGAMGMLFALPALFMAIAYLKLSASTLDRLSFALPAATIVQRIGCLLTGCCYGLETNLPWAITYGQGSLAWHH